MSPLPFHLELKTYFLELVGIFRRSDSRGENFSTIFMFSSDPLQLLHLTLQRAHDDKINPTCGATVIPPAFRSNLPMDVIERYSMLSNDPRFTHMVFPELTWNREIPQDLHDFVVRSIDEEHEKFVKHL